MEGSNSKMKTLDKIGSKLISQITGEVEFGWPPECAGLLYQPERPVPQNTMVNDTETGDCSTGDK